MTNTPNLALPYLAAAQAQKHVTVNEALSLIDALSQMAVNSIGATSPPGAPTEGERHIIGTGATGAWAGWDDNNIALFSGGAWLRLIPQAGWMAWDVSAGELLVWSGPAWVSFVPNLQNLLGVGIGTSSDATNRLAVSAAATLLNHAGNGHQLKINKAASGDTVSLLFQSGWFGRAEMGLAGDDDFHFKVSADGSIWSEALLIDRNTGRMTLLERVAVKSPSGATTAMQVEEEELTLSGAYVESSIVIPNRAIVLGVSTHTTQTITGASSYDCGIAGEPSKFGGSLGIAIDSTNSGVIGPTAFYSDTPIRLSANGGNFTGGKVRIAIHTLTCGVPMS